MLRRGRGRGNPADRGGAGGLGAVLALTFLASLSTGAVNNGVFFVAQEAHGFGRALNLALGLVVGGVYVPAALAVGPALRRLAESRPGVTTRRTLVALMVAMAGLAALPVAAPAPWAIWVFAALYIPLMGALWPIVEAYLSGGRRGPRLRHAIGAFNLAWAAAVAAAAWGMSPALGLGRPLMVFLGLGLVHLACLAPVLRLTPDPPRHLHEPEAPHPAVYVGLLACFRRLLFLSYVLLAALSPILPWRLDGLGLATGWQLPLASAWMAGRLGVFALMQRWGGWHGRWRTPVWASSAMIGGVVLTLTAPAAWMTAVGLAAFGVGIGAIYAAGLYYAMEVGAAEVDAGGRHEAMIGLGYGTGPMLGLAAIGIERVWAGAQFAPTLAWLAVGVSAVGLALAARAGRRAMRPGRPSGKVR